MHGPMRGPAQHPAQTLATTSAARPRAPPAAAASLPRRQGHQHGRVLLGSRMMRVCASGFVHTATMPPHHVSRLHEPVGSRARTEQASRACRRGRTPLTETAQPASVLNLNLLLGLQQHSTPHKPQHATARPSCRAQSAACHRPPLLLSSERGGRGEPGRVRTGAAILPRQICGEAGGCGAGAAPVLESFHDFLPESAQPLCDQLLSRPSPCMRLALAAPFGSPEPQPDPQPEPQPDPQPAPSSNN